MEVFNLVVDQKSTIWERLYVTVEAESLKEAIAKCRDSSYEVGDSEVLYDSMEFLSPTESDPVTEEIFDEDDLNHPIFTNDIRIR